MRHASIKQTLDYGKRGKQRQAKLRAANARVISQLDSKRTLENSVLK
jgi:hypothetical protein